jgi:hypothetical protein
MEVKIIMVKGTVTYNGQTYTDSCAYCTGACLPGIPCTPNCYAVVEYYCENGVMKQETHTCGSGYTCQDGACKPSKIIQTSMMDILNKLSASLMSLMELLKQ